MAIFDVVKYENKDNSVLVWKWPGDQLAWGSRVIVNQTQEAIFYKNGQALDLLGPGSHTLETENIPLLEHLVNIPFGNQTPFPAEVYFIDKATILDVKWGTPKPVPILDPILNIFLPIRANGQFGFRVKDSRRLVVQLVGTVSSLSKNDIVNYFRGIILTKTKDYIASQLMERRLSILTVTSCLDDMSKNLKIKLQDDFAMYGLEIANFLINAIDVPEDDPEVQHVKQAMANKAEMRILGDDAYRMKRTFDVLESAAKNEGGGNMMTAGLGMGMGMGAGNNFASMAGGAMALQPPAQQLGVGRQPRQQFARARAFEEGLVERQQVAVQRAPQVGHHALAQQRHEVEARGGGQGLQPPAQHKALPGPGGGQPADMVTCQGCGNKSYSAFKFCTTCGAGLVTPNAVCPTCGVELPVGAKFCGHCGLKLTMNLCPFCKNPLPAGAAACPTCNSKPGGVK